MVDNWIEFMDRKEKEKMDWNKIAKEIQENIRLCKNPNTNRFEKAFIKLNDDGSIKNVTKLGCACSEPNLNQAIDQLKEVAKSNGLKAVITFETE